MKLEELLQKHPFSEMTIPDAPIERIQMFVRELAIGAMEELWSPRYWVDVDKLDSSKRTWNDALIQPNAIRNLLTDYIAHKWNQKAPRPQLLTSLGFFNIYDPGGQAGLRYELNQNAWELALKPQLKPIFISYRNKDSSAFALLTLARMKEIGFHPFLDITGLKLGDKWKPELEDHIKLSSHMICLIGKNTLQKSEIVRREISLADQNNLKIIAVLHNGQNRRSLVKLAVNSVCLEAAQILLDTQHEVVKEETTSEYNRVILNILNTFGFTP